MELKRNYAFISYSHHDMKAAKWLHKKLESYRLPAEIHNEFEDSRFLRPVFRDQEDLNAGVLGQELRKHLESSKFLVVICSPRSAKSEWVNNEVKTFIEWGRLEYIIPLIVDGTPNSGDEQECFPQALRDYAAAHPDSELLGVSLPEVGKEKAFVRVVSRMLGVSFDELWRRHERERRRRMLAWLLGTPVAAFLLYYFAVPVTLTVALQDDRHQLPMPEDATIVVGDAEYPLQSLDTTLVIRDLPGYYKGRSLPIVFSATYYKPVKNQVNIGFQAVQSYAVALQRDSTFAVFAGTIRDDNGQPVVATITIGDSVTQSGPDGRFSLVFPVEAQRESMSLSIRAAGMREILRDDECPSSELKYIMHQSE